MLTRLLLFNIIISFHDTRQRHSTFFLRNGYVGRIETFLTILLRCFCGSWLVHLFYLCVCFVQDLYDFVGRLLSFNIIEPFHDTRQRHSTFFLRFDCVEWQELGGEVGLGNKSQVICWQSPVFNAIILFNDTRQRHSTFFLRNGCFG